MHRKATRRSTILTEVMRWMQMETSLRTLCKDWRNWMLLVHGHNDGYSTFASALLARRKESFADARAFDTSERTTFPTYQDPTPSHRASAQHPSISLSRKIVSPWRPGGSSRRDIICLLGHHNV